MKFLVTGAWAQGKSAIEKLNRLGLDAVFMQNEKDELPCFYEDVVGVICNGLFLYHPIEKFQNLKYIQLTSAGYDRVPVEYITKKNIKIFNAGGVYSIPMAEFALTGVLNLYKKASFFKENQIKHKWEKNRDILELYKKTVCIIGCGSVGTECAKRFNAFGCKVYGIDISSEKKEFFNSIELMDKLEDLLKNADIVVVTLPLTEETRYLVNREILSCFKKNAVLVNISRGGIVDTAGLIEALNNNLGGAVLDVFEDEPLDSESPLWNFDNVIITPHNSFVGDGNSERLWQLIFKNLSVVFGDENEQI